MKPFLLLQIRPEDPASNGEYEAILKFGELNSENIDRVRVDQLGVPDVDFNDYSAIIVGGGPWNPGDPEEKKSTSQKNAEVKFIPLMHRIIDSDFPFLGICYGLEILIKSLRIEPTHDFFEPASAINLKITDEGSLDPLLAGLPRSFRGLGGHKESAPFVPADGALLISSKTCPVHMFRLGNNVYLTQFHPELDSDGMCTRIDVYKNNGYFPPEEAEALKDQIRKEQITVPTEILRRFVSRYKT